MECFYTGMLASSKIKLETLQGSTSFLSEAFILAYRGVTLMTYTIYLCIRNEL